MSTRYFNFREGDRSEYLATYFFSAVGLVTPVPRQEDIGFDMVCSIADQESGRLTFNHQYLLSVKSLSTPNIELFPTKSEDGSLPHIAWLFRQELPFLLAVVDKKKQEVRVYSTLPIWFIHFVHFDCGSVSLVPRVGDDQEDDVESPVKGYELDNPAGTFHYTVDLGHPIMRATISDLTNIEKLKTIRNNLRKAVHYGRLTALHVHMGVPYFYWFARTQPDGSEPTPAFFVNQVPNVKMAKDYTYSRIAPTLISLAMLYKANDDAEKLEAVSKLLTSVPSEQIPDPVKEHIPEIAS